MPTLQLDGIDPSQQPLHETVAVEVKEALFGTIGYPQLKSDVVIVRNDPFCKGPMYCFGSPQERIILKSSGNAPWQYAHQLAHEFGHMSARSDLRFPRRDGLFWIEEVLADCHSLIALHRLRQLDGSLKTGADAYLRDLLAEPQGKAIDQAWFNANRGALHGAATLTGPCQAIARHIFTNLGHERILRDNRLLIELETGLELSAFLEQWEKLSRSKRSVPSILRALL